MIRGRIYIILAKASLALAFFCHFIAIFRFHADNLVILSNGATLHDLIYYASDGAADLCLMFTSTSLAYFISNEYPHAVNVMWLKYALLTYLGMRFIGQIFNFFFYEKITTFELILDLCVVLIGIWRVIKFYKNLNNSVDATTAVRSVVNN